MSETKTAGTAPAHRESIPSPESQKQRWIKYGGNVALTIVVAVVVAVLAIYLGQTFSLRKDTTAAHTHSLSDATVDLIQNLPSKVKLVSLYTKVKRVDDTGKSDAGSADSAVRYREVSDLLEEYQRKGKNISIEIIDPFAEPAKVQQLFDEVSNKYGNNVNLYRDTLANFSKTVDDITKLVDQETVAIKNVPSSKNQGMELTLALLRQTVDQFPEDLRDLQTTLPAELKKPNPDYKRAAEAARTKLGELSRNLQGMIDGFVKAQEDLKPGIAELQQTVATQPSTTQPSVESQGLTAIQTFLAYAKESAPRYEKIKKLADDLIGRLRNLGELKQLDELRDKKTDSIVVMGDKDMIVIPRDRLWRAPLKGLRSIEGETDQPRFAGEQQISTALVVLTAADRPRVAFVRAGGPPLTIRIENEEIGSYTGPYYAIAEKLREYNFDVVEKDIAGQWAQQAMQLQMRAPDIRLPREAADDELEKAVWVVRPGREPDPMSETPPPSVGKRLSEHLASGGSAMVLFGVQDDPMTAVLAPWGVSAQPGTVVFHDRPPETEGRVSDQVDQWRREQALFVLNNYGDHAITAPVQSLDLMLVPVVPVMTTEARGYTISKLLPLTDGALQVFGKNIRQIHSRAITFDPVQDLKPPLFGGAAVEKAAGAASTGQQGGNRLVVFGSGEFANNQWTTLREKDVQRGGSNAPRFPGNTELFTNSIFWLSKMEKMMSIAPASRDVALIAPVGRAAMGAWRTTILLLVPLIVLSIGGRIYFARRD